MLRPELQDPAVYADSIDNIVTAMRTAAEHYFADGSAAHAVPPLRALLHLMRDGTWEGRSVNDPAFRKLFDRDLVLSSDWYQARLMAQQSVEIRLWERHVRYLEEFSARHPGTGLPLAERATAARTTLTAVRAPTYAQSLHGTLGADPTLAGS
jgi:hypothetical protein